MIEGMTTPPNNADTTTRHPLGDDFWEQLRTDQDRLAEIHEEQIRKAAEASPGKEAFDPAVLKQYYSPGELEIKEQHDPALDEASLRELRYKYYVDHPEIDNLEQFGNYMHWLDQNEAS